MILPEDVSVGEKLKEIYRIILDLTSISFFNDERLFCTQSAPELAEGTGADTATAECFITSGSFSPRAVPEHHRGPEADFLQPFPLVLP